ncbi:MAG TPA: GntR family transcriptional regulator [Gaiellaceae bacterium]|jgi:DNA-binding GntR family transcriptional regulator
MQVSMSSAAAVPFLTKAELAYARVRELVLTGALEPGSTLNQEMLARELGISTTPLREALGRLESEGLVELGAHRDARVSPLTAEEARDLLELRLSLDPLAARLAAERRTDADLEALDSAAAELRPLDHDPDVATLATHRRFHAAIYHASHNELLIETLDGLWDRADRYRRLALDITPKPERRVRVAKEHAGLVLAIRRGLPDVAAELMRKHIDRGLGARALRQLGDV